MKEEHKTDELFLVRSINSLATQLFYYYFLNNVYNNYLIVLLLLELSIEKFLSKFYEPFDERFPRN